MIEARALCKQYGKLQACADISFTLQRGTITALLGANGAGKTTLLRMLCGYHLPDSGEALICGHSLTLDPVQARSCVGFVPERPAAYPWMTVHATLVLSARLFGCSAEEARASARSTAQKCQLTGQENKLVKHLSHGTLQKLNLAQALVHDPAVLILDEPASGLDPATLSEFRSLLLGLSAEKTILLSTHILQDVEALCGAAIIMKNGRLCAHDSLESLKAMTAKKNLEAAYLQVTEKAASHEE